MNNNTYIFYDFESGSRNPLKTQPIQIAAVAIDGRTLKIDTNNVFESLMRPVSDEEAKILGIDPIEDQALEVNKKTRSELETAPERTAVWRKFCDYVDSYNFKKDRWGAPISVGYNNLGFDNIIANRLNIEVGRFDKETDKPTLFHPIWSLDLMHEIFKRTENLRDLRSYSFDSVREWLGLSKAGAHDAKTDVLQGAQVFVRFMQLSRRVAQKTKFRGTMANGNTDS